MDNTTVYNMNVNVYLMNDESDESDEFDNNDYVKCRAHSDDLLFCKYVVDNMVKTFDGVGWSTRMMSNKDLDNIDECIDLLQKIRETMVIDQ